MDLTTNSNIVFEMIGVLAGILIAATSFPQLIQTHRTKDVEGLSFNTFLILTASAVCWTFYGWYLHSLQMMFFNSLTFASSIYVLYMIKKYKK